MNRVPRTIILILMAAVIIVPLVPLIGWAFSTGWTYPNLLPDDFTWQSFADFLQKDRYKNALINSVVLSTVVTLISLVLGFPAAKLLGTREFVGRRFVEVFVLLPALTPAISIIFGLRDEFVGLGLFKTYTSLVIAEVVFTLPYMIMILTPVFRDYDTDYELQSTTLGVGRLRTLVHVTVPAVRSGMVVACMYTFMVSWSIYLFVYFLMPANFNTMTTVLFPLMTATWTSYSTIAVLTVLFILPALIVFIISSKLLSKDSVNKRGLNQ